MDLEARKVESQLARRAATSPHEGKANGKPTPKFGPPFKPKINGCSLHKELTETLGDFHAVSPFLARQIQSQVVGTDLIPLTPGKLATSAQSDTPDFPTEKLPISSEIQSIIEATKVGTPLSAIRTPAVASSDPLVFDFPTKPNKPSTDSVVQPDNLEAVYRQVGNIGGSVEPRRSQQETNSAHSSSANACLPPKKRHLSGSNKEETTSNNQAPSSSSSGRLFPSISPLLCDLSEPQPTAITSDESLSNENLSKSPSAYDQRKLDCFGNDKRSHNKEDSVGHRQDSITTITTVTMKAEQPFEQPSFNPSPTGTFDIFQIEANLKQIKQPNNPDVPSPSAGPSQTDAEGSTEATENKVSNAECRKPAKVAKPWKTKQKPSVSPSDSEKKSHNKKEDKTNSASSNKANGSKSSTPATKSSAGSEEKRHSSCGGSNREESAPKRNKTKSSRPEEISSPKKEVVTTTTGKDQRQKVEKTEAHKDESPDTPDSGIERDLASPEKINNNPFSPGNVSVFGDHMSASEFDDPQPSTSSVAPRFGRNRRISDILAESTQLSPLLSPIPEISFPPFFEDPSGFPHLLARLNFSLLSKIPPPPLSPVPSVAPSDQSVSSRQNNRKSHANDKDDLDGMPLLDRLNSSNSFSDKKSKKNSSNGSETTSKVPSSTKSQPKIEADLTKKSKSDQKPGQMKPSDHHTAKKHSTSSGVVVTESHHTKSLSTPYQSSPPSTIDSVVLSVVTQMSKDSTNNKSPSMKRCKQDGTKDPSEPPLKKVALTTVPEVAQMSPANISVSGAPAVSCSIPDGNGPEDEKKFFEQAKMLKKTADTQADKRAKLLFYLESTVYYILTALEQEKKGQPDSSFNRPYSLITETYNLLKTVATDNVGDPNHSGKLFCLSLRLQALMSKHLYDLRQPQSLSNFKKVNEYHKEKSKDKRPITPCSNCTPTSTPSPSSSAGSCLPAGHVAIPQPMEALIKQQLQFLHNLMFADCHWKQADSALKLEDKPFFDHLDKICGCLTFSSSPRDLCVYVLTAIRWLRDIMALPQSTVTAAR